MRSGRRGVGRRCLASRGIWGEDTHFFLSSGWENGFRNFYSHRMWCRGSLIAIVSDQWIEGFNPQPYDAGGELG